MADSGSTAPSGQGSGESAGRRLDLVSAALIAFGAFHLALGAFMVVAPGTFFAEIGPFGVQNDHYIRDNATFNLAFGVLLLAALRYRSWRVPVVAVVLVQFALHTVNHLVDIGEARPEWVGYADFAALLVATALLAGVLRAAWRESPGGSPATGPNERRTAA